MSLGRPVAVSSTRLVAVLLCFATPLAAEWFDDYSRALEALGQKKGERAAELLVRAIRQRPEPGTNVLTYGTNRIDAYHPYLKLAEAQLLAGNLKGAREALQTSEARGREPAAERARLVAELDTIEKARVAAAAPPPTVPATTPAAAAPIVLAPPPLPIAPPAAGLPPVAAPSPEVALGTLDLRTEPPGAAAFLGARRLGTSPLRVDLAPGAYEITLRKEGTADQTFPVRVVAARVALETRALIATASAPTPAPAAPAEVTSLVVYSDPPGASVYLDDEPLGATAPGSGRLVKTGVGPGPHRLRLAKEGRPDAVEDVQIGPAGPTTVRVSLSVVERGLPWPAVGGGLLVLVLALAGWRRRTKGPAERRGHTVVLPARSGTATGTPAAGPDGTLTHTPSTPRARATSVPERTVDAADLELEALVEETRAHSPSKTAGVGERFGEYLLLDLLGKGGMASVYQAERNREYVALKRPLAAFLEEQEFLDRFLREAEIGRTLHHPNIIRIFERGHVGGIPYFTMELVKGETLQAHVRRTGALSARAAVRVVVQVAEALDYAHLKGVVHRDLKPSNIMMLEDGTAKVMDYGIARARRFEGLTVTGSFLGTPEYVAPETAEGKGTDARSDLYSLGIVFYEILTGQRPFTGDTPFATLRKHVSEPPPAPSLIAPNVPLEIEAIVLRLLAKDPADRYPGAEELLIALREYLNRAA